jgi:GntR family transcriptional regulator
MNKKIKDIERLIHRSIPFQKSDSNGSPVYFQLAIAIQKQIEKGRLKAGALIPSERKIASVYNISIATVRNAFDDLIKKGHVHRIQGKGTYVSGTSDRRQKIRYYPFVEGFHDESKPSDIKFVELKIIEGQTWINDQLKIREDEQVYLLKRIITTSELPAAYCVSYLPRKMFKGLEDYSQTEIEKFSLYIFIEQNYNISTIKHIELFSAGRADQETANQLNVEQDKALLRVEKLIFTHKDRPYEYRISHCVTDACKIRRII